MPIAAYTSDSRFPVIVGNSVATTPVFRSAFRAMPENRSALPRLLPGLP